MSSLTETQKQAFQKHRIEQFGFTSFHSFLSSGHLQDGEAYSLFTDGRFGGPLQAL